MENNRNKHNRNQKKRAQEVAHLVVEMPIINLEVANWNPTTATLKSEWIKEIIKHEIAHIIMSNVFYYDSDDQSEVDTGDRWEQKKYGNNITGGSYIKFYNGFLAKYPCYQ